MNKIHPVALFRFSVLGQLVSRTDLSHGELNEILEHLASKSYQIPNSKRMYISKQTIQNWYYKYKIGGIDALTPKQRKDKASTKITLNAQNAILEVKQDNRIRSIKTIITMLEGNDIVLPGELNKSSVYRFLKRNNLSTRSKSGVDRIERRSFVSEYACDLWQGDVLHGPSIMTASGLRKTYLVSIMDDASRLIVHSEFCFDEASFSIEKVLKQALLKRGMPIKFMVDNGSAYKTKSLSGICARLKIQLIRCRVYEPQAKGKLERFHRTFREQFLAEIHASKVTDINDLNHKLWGWLDQVYHVTEHEGIEDKEYKSPIERYRKDIKRIRKLNIRVEQLDNLFYYREKRKVHKDGTIKYEGAIYEVPHNYVGKTITIVVNPYTPKALHIESEDGIKLEDLTLLDKNANLHRNRQRPNIIPEQQHQPILSAVEIAVNKRDELIKIALDTLDKGD